MGRVAFTAADVELRPTVAALPAQADAERADPKLPPPCGPVRTRLQDHGRGLTRFRDDRRITLDNHASERRIGGPALGRKNSSGSGAFGSGRLAATLVSRLATLTLAKINVRTWLTWFLNCWAANRGQVPSDITAFLPWARSVETRREMALDRDASS